MGSLNRHYPHLLDDDIALWMDFLTEHNNQYLSYDYDIRVGPGRDPGPEVGQNIRDMAIRLSQRRIDVVAHAQDSITLFEICQTAQYRPIAQLAIYATHYQHDFQPTKPLKQGVICRVMPQDIADFCRNVGYEVHIYPPEPTV